MIRRTRLMPHVVRAGVVYPEACNPMPSFFRESGGRSGRRSAANLLSSACLTANRRSPRVVLLLIVFFALSSAGFPTTAGSSRSSKQVALAQYETAERMREALNGRSAKERTRRDYLNLATAYRKVYYKCPASSKADESIVAVAEILAEMGRQFPPGDKDLRAAIGQYEFLRREYPGSKYRFEALFTIGQIYKEDLDDESAAQATFEEFLKRYPRNQLAPKAQEALAELSQPKAKPKSEVVARKDAGATDTEAKAEGEKTLLARVTGIRHWSTADYTRVAIDLDSEVKYEAGRVPDPDRIFFDLSDSRLVSTLVGKNLDVHDGFLKKIRVAQYQPDSTRVVLEVDDVAEYSAFLLPNPYRLIIDIHGREPNAKSQVAASPPPGVAADEYNAKGGPPAPSSVRVPSKVSPATATTELAAGKIPSSGQAQASKASTKPSVVIAGADLPNDSSDDSLSAATKAGKKPTAAPTAVTVAPDKKSRGNKKVATASGAPAIHEASPTADGDRSLIRALGLKIGRIVIDAGHGGHDTGTIGPNGLQEKDLVLDVALRLGKLLESRLGADVIYTRDDDTFIPLETRTAIANEHQADLFISVHANSSRDSSARGVETYYLNFTSNPDALEVAARENAVSEKSIHELQDLVKKITLKEKIEESRELATDVQQSLYAGLSPRNPTLHNRGVKKAPFVVLIGANMPSILAEISFVSNPVDEKKMETPEYRQKIAEALYKGIAKYISGLSGVKVAAKIEKDAGK